MPYRLIKQEGAARRGEFTTVHGTVQTPAFQNVATAAAIKGGLSALDLKDIRAQVMLCNTYHLHLRPGDKLVAEMGGLHKFTKWDGPILTDSGGFQVFSLAKLRHITEEGVTFNSHLDGHRIFMGPEQSMQIQANLGSTIAMAFDECVENPATYEYAKNSCARTARWLLRCKDEMNRLRHEEKAVNPDQLLFGINQGCTFADLRDAFAAPQLCGRRADDPSGAGRDVQSGGGKIRRWAALYQDPPAGHDGLRRPVPRCSHLGAHDAQRGAELLPPLPFRPCRHRAELRPARLHRGG